MAAEDNVADEKLWREQVQPFLRKHCFDCHGDNDGDAGLNLAKYQTAADVFTHRKTFEHVFRMINAEAMPPGDFDPQPTSADRAMVVTWLEDQLYNFDCDLIDDPGRPTIRRLNRGEYNNTIRDLVGVDFKPAEDFPSDDVGEGFDNIGDVLSLSPLLLEKYLDAAEQITARAIVADDLERPRTLTKPAPQLTRAGAARLDGRFMVMYSTGEARADFTLPATGDYVIRIEAKATQAGDEVAKMELRVNGDAVHVWDVPGEQQVNTFEHSMRLSAGDVRIAGRFINDTVKDGKDRNLFVRQIQLVGPENATDVVYPETHSRLVIARPDKGRSVRQAASQVLQTFARRAFRRPVSADEVQKYVDLAVMAVEDQGESYNRGIQLAVQAILVSPHFLFRVEHDPDPQNPAARHPVNDHELASRLSYFLWSSMPDEELLGLADQQRLHRPEVLTAQARRMLRDPKSAALTDNFATQWLNLRSLTELTPDPDQFPSFTDKLRDDMVTETRMLFDSIVRNDRSVLDFLNADYTFVNERLAKHYELPDVRGDMFRRISLDGTGRAGVTTHASVLTLTSNPTRTSPVKRGKWILENLLNDAPPDPPPNVPDLAETAKANPNLSLREQLAIHRESPTCASCHKTMDPLGFGFESFDAIGRFRKTADGRPVDSSGKLPTGESFSGATELIDILSQRREEFCRCLAEKMMIYALGRGLDYYDRCAIDRIYERMDQQDLRFSALVEGIVLSRPFLERRGEAPAAPE